MAKKDKGKKLPSLSDVLGDIAKTADLKIGAIGSVAADIEGLSTGNIILDHATGVGGLPMGRHTELFGPPSSGKSTCALQVAVQAQRQGITTLYMDYEHALDPVYCSNLGLDIRDDSFLLAQPDSLEQGVNAARQLVETGQVGLIIWDSVAMMTPEMIMTQATGQVSVAAQARLISQALQQLKAPVKEFNVCNVFINHVKEVIEIAGNRPGHLPPRKTTPGGVALKFYASMRIEFTPTGKVMGTEFDDTTQGVEKAVVAQKVRATVVKNKVAPPFKTANMQVRFGKGFSQAYSCLQILIAHKKVRKDGAFYRIRDERLEHEDFGRNDKGCWVKGEAGLLTMLEQDPDLLAVWEAVTIECLEDQPDEVYAPVEPLQLTEAVPDDLMEQLAGDEVEVPEFAKATTGKTSSSAALGLLD